MEIDPKNESEDDVSYERKPTENQHTVIFKDNIAVASNFKDNFSIFQLVLQHTT